MAEQCVVVEADLGIETFQNAVLVEDQRIDLKQRHVIGDEGGIELFCQTDCLFARNRPKVSAHAAMARP